MTTYFSWRYVFVGEVVIMIFVVIFAGRIGEKSERASIRIDVLSVLLSAFGLVGVVFGMLQSKTWGWIVPAALPRDQRRRVAPLGISLTAWFIVARARAARRCSSRRQRRLVATGTGAARARRPALDPCSCAAASACSARQYAITAGLFFMVPVYLQMTLGFDALQTGIRIFPLSISLILFSIVGTRLSARWSPRRIVRVAQWILVASSILLLGGRRSRAVESGVRDRDVLRRRRRSASSPRSSAT